MKDEVKNKETLLVIDAQRGDKAAFEKLLLRYQRRIYGYAMAQTSSASDASDIVQETFLKVYLNLTTLREAVHFSSWLYAICNNCVYSYLRDKARKRNHEIDHDIADITMIDDQNEFSKSQIESEWEMYFDSLRLAIAVLNQELKDVIQLKYFAGLSYQEIAATCGIDVKRVKSRLYEGRQKIKQQLPHLYHGLEYDYHQSHEVKEKIMKSIDNISNGSYVFERLSLYQQTALCQSVQSNRKFNESLLADINKIQGGINFVSQYNARLSLPELVNILTYVDNNTMFRVFSDLEENDPELSETLKQNMFIFEDIILFDQEALKILHERLDHITLKTALSNASPQLRQHVLQLVPESEKKDWHRHIINSTPYGHDVKNAQCQVIYECYKMVEEKLIRVERNPDGVQFTVRNG